MVQKNSLIDVIVVCGPTASGKTALSIELAKKLNTSVISADSMYIYKGMNIGTAKPSLEEMDGVEHFMIDVVNPNDTFSVSDYKNLATKPLNQLISQNKIPIICGGTGFYINSLLYDLSYGNSGADTKLREHYNNVLQTKGNEYLFSLLKAKDIETANKLHPNDTKRVIRALEIFDLTGQKKSETNDKMNSKYNFIAISINHDRDVLYQKINNRVETMFEKGLVNEVKDLLNCGINKSAQSMQAIGYKEIIDYLDNNSSLEETKELIKINSRHYAKRQITFFKKLDNHIYLKPDNKQKLSDKVLKEYVYR